MVCQKVYITIRLDSIWPHLLLFLLHYRQLTMLVILSSWGSWEISDPYNEMVTIAAALLAEQIVSISKQYGNNAHVCSLLNFVSIQSGQQDILDTTGSSNPKANGDKGVKYQLLDDEVDVSTPVCFPVYAFIWRLDLVDSPRSGFSPPPNVSLHFKLRFEPFCHSVSWKLEVAIQIYSDLTARGEKIKLYAK